MTRWRRRPSSTAAAPRGETAAVASPGRNRGRWPRASSIKAGYKADDYARMDPLLREAEDNADRRASERGR